LAIKFQSLKPDEVGWSGNVADSLRETSAVAARGARYIVACESYNAETPAKQHGLIRWRFRPIFFRIHLPV
jgi:hypothetical protein